MDRVRAYLPTPLYSSLEIAHIVATRPLPLYSFRPLFPLCAGRLQIFLHYTVEIRLVFYIFPVRRIYEKANLLTGFRLGFFLIRR
jgi:hypothetical protein